MTAPQPSKRTIPQDREGHNSFLHNLFIATLLISRVKPGWLLPGWLALVAIAAWPWTPWRGVAGLLAALSLASDWIILALLPVRGRSWGPVTPSLLALTLLRTTLSWLLAQILPPTAGLILFFLTNGILSGLVYYATWVEPFRLDITHQQIQIPTWPENSPLCALHISDLHFEGYSPREEALEAAVQRLNPDLIFLTGDYLNLSSVHDPKAQAEARALLARLEAPLGIYAITGSPAVDVEGIIPQIFEGLPIHWLRDKAQSISLETGEIWLLGIRCTTNLDRDGAALKELAASVPDGAPTLLLYHSPDLMPQALDLGIDLYLAGHTHGGQLRLPIFGAIFTSSRWGKRYEMGRYEEKATTLYVSRGLGVEGLGAPRARFLAPPEIIRWEIGPPVNLSRR